MASIKVSDFPTRLRELMQENNMTQAELSRRTNITPSSISDWLNYKYDAKQDKIDTISAVFNVSPAYMMGYDVGRERDVRDISLIPGIIPLKKIKKIPILGSIICGEPIFTGENYEGYFPADPELFDADFSLYAEGDSMIDAGIHEGDLVFFRQVPDADNGTIVAVLIDGKATLKKLNKTKDAVIFQPCNDAYEPIVVTKEDYKDVLIIGEMKAVLSMRNK